MGGFRLRFTKAEVIRSPAGLKGGTQDRAVGKGSRSTTERRGKLTVCLPGRRKAPGEKLTAMPREGGKKFWRGPKKVRDSSKREEEKREITELGHLLFNEDLNWKDRKP